MFVKIICVVLFVSSALSRNVPKYRDLDEEDQMLFRAAYDSYDNPSYNHDAPSYSPDTYNNYDSAMPVVKLDLIKDGMWALKAKMKELKAFNKALAASLLLTKIQVKELLAHHMKPLKTHHHVEVDEKPAYHYQPSPQPSYPQYDAPAPQYNPPAPQNNAPAPQYSAPAPQYSAPAPHYSEPAPQYSAHHYVAPQPVHDPYYGH